jgi:hypothetical protein
MTPNLTMHWVRFVVTFDSPRRSVYLRQVRGVKAERPTKPDKAIGEADA